tara:strand:+ start:113 stop:1111 length:999 start_codon:yes stop_codon:yes gene_type:complete
MNIDTYVVLSTTIFKLSKSQMYAFHQTFRYKDLFSILSKKLNKDLYKIAKRRIAKKLSGGIVNEMFIKKTNFGSYKVNRLIRKTDNIKILIASHNFYDAIHHRGLLLFPDYYQWLIYLFKYSKNTNYDWYIKTHIDEDKSTEEIIKKLLDNNKHITLLPSDSSHHQLIQEGIDFCLTVDGTIGLEYAYLNKKVINASINNVHMSYNFNFNPSSFDDYSILLNNLKKLKLEINKDEILEFYYMHYIYNTNNWFFKKYNDFLDDNKGYFGQFNIDAIKYFNKNFNLNRKKQIIKLLNDFIQSKDYSLYEFIIKNKNKKEIENLLDVDNQFQNVE